MISYEHSWKHCFTHWIQNGGFKNCLHHIVKHKNLAIFLKKSIVLEANKLGPRSGPTCGTWPGIHQHILVLETQVWDFQMLISQKYFTVHSELLKIMCNVLKQ